MFALGIELTKEDMSRIVSAVGTLAISMADGAENEKEMREAFSLSLLHLKLVHAFSEGIKEFKKSESQKDAEDDSDDDSN